MAPSISAGEQLTHSTSQPTQSTLPLTAPATQQELFQSSLDNEGNEDNSNDLLGLCGVLVEVSDDSPVVLSILRGQCLKVGRHHTCNVVLEGDAISNLHCLLTATLSGNVYCQDKSSNGTFWNGVLIGKNESILLSQGDSIRLRPYHHFIFQDLMLRKERHIDPQIKTVNKTYNITSCVLGKGTFAKVYLAIHRKTKVQLAVKIMDLTKFGQHSRSGGTDFRQEVALLRTLKHANIISIVDVQFTGLFVYIFLQMMHGGDLFDYVITNGRLQEKEGKFIGYQVLLALEYLHGKNIVHRDLKPENVLLTGPSMYPRALLTDFGMARKMKGNGFMTTMCGTYAYMAPEVFDVKHSGGPGYNTSADCWAFGVLLYVILSAMHPFASNQHKDDELIVMDRIKSRRPNFSSNAWSDKSPHCFEVIAKLLVLDPAKRWTAKQTLGSAWIGQSLSWLEDEYARTVTANWERHLRMLDIVQLSLPAAQQRQQQPQHLPEQTVPASVSCSSTWSSFTSKVAAPAVTTHVRTSGTDGGGGRGACDKRGTNPPATATSTPNVPTSNASFYSSNSFYYSADATATTSIMRTTTTGYKRPREGGDRNSSGRSFKRHQYDCSQEALFTIIRPSIAGT